MLGRLKPIPRREPDGNGQCPQESEHLGGLKRRVEVVRLLVKCPICDITVEPAHADGPDMYRVRCPACGEYEISWEATTDCCVVSHPNRYILSGKIRWDTELRRQAPVLLTGNIRTYLDESLLPATFSERLDLILQYMVSKTQRAGDYVVLRPLTDYPIGFAKDPEEFCYLLQVLEQRRYVENPGEGKYRLTPNGWARADQMRRSRPGTGRKCFVAMWFDPALDVAYADGFGPAIRETGYDPVRVDRKQFNDKVCDRIIVEIRQSRLVVADVTGQRGGVYFEAGFALGLGLPVIWTCRKDDAKNIHFDTRQYNHILWEDAGQLRERLRDRIIATAPLLMVDRVNQGGPGLRSCV